MLKSIQNFLRESNTNTAKIKAYQAFVEAFIPIEQSFENIQSIGASDLKIENYIIWELDHFVSIQWGLSVMTVPLSDATAKLLNAGARHLIDLGKLIDPQNLSTLSNEDTFASLSRVDRFKALSLLEQLDIDLGSLPAPYRHNAALVKFMIDTLNRLVVFGYYSEWAGYGSTRLADPDKRKIEQFPLSWKQVGYPGPSLGYRDFRGFLL